MISRRELEHVDLRGLKTRLLKSGWQVMPRPGVLRAPDGRFYTLPSRLKDDLDFVALDILVRTLIGDGSVNALREIQHKIEGRKEDLLFLGCEILGLTPGKLPASHAPIFYEKSNRFLRSTALSLQADRNLTSRRGIYERLTYGETKQSSYLVAVHVPIDTIADPIGRAFVRKTVAATESLHRAIERESDSELSSTVEGRWTADMCEAILGFVEDRQFTEFKLQAVPDPIWEDAKPMTTSEIVVPLKSGIAESVLTAAASRLRQLTPSERVEVVGVPFESRDYSVIGEGEKRTVGILWRREGAGNLRVQAEMSESAYEQMLSSQSKRMVRVSGILRQRGSRWILEVEGEPSLFEEIAEVSVQTKVLSLDEIDLDIPSFLKRDRGIVADEPRLELDVGTDSE